MTDKPGTVLNPLFRQLQDQKWALDNSAIVAQTDARGRITMVNDKFCEISGYSRDELLGQDHRIINSGTHPKAFFTEMWRTIARGHIWRADICNRAKTGNLYWVATTITPFLDENGRPYQYLAIRQDITALKEAQHKITEQQAQLVQASRMSAIGEMASAITHEINNPLGVILGRAEMISTVLDKGTYNVETLKRLVDTIAVTGKRIEKIVRSMKALAHPGIDEEPFYPASAREIVSDALELCAQRFRNHGIQLTTPEIDPELEIDCRSHQIVQVLVNILHNAHDAVLNLEQKWVKIGISVNKSSIMFTITDSGPGVAPENLNKLFQPFFSTKKVQYGTGLGLSISRSIIQNHHGELTYESESPNTCFVIRLPLKQEGTLHD